MDKTFMQLLEGATAANSIKLALGVADVGALKNALSCSFTDSDSVQRYLAEQTSLAKNLDLIGASRTEYLYANQQAQVLADFVDKSRALDISSAGVKFARICTCFAGQKSELTQGLRAARCWPD